ncbi:hypothetical protein NL108_010374 [Boleophthalmus pectinirostris]|nr:hypothetical protein NL108_010374 [Boleophthalmus pectinirostris]
MARGLCFVLLVIYLGEFWVHGRDVFTNHWAVRVTGGHLEADRVAAKYGYRNLGQIGSLEDHYHFHHSRVVRRAAFPFRGTHSFIHMDPQVQWVQQQKVKTREKRSIQNDPNFNFNDPKWSSMWYIHCNDKSSPCHNEMNILGAWKKGYTGKNVVVTILDDGIERNHPDLAPNYDHLASYDVNGNDYDPTPRYDFRNQNIHGTRCAGEVAAAANNSHCIVGVAFNAHIGGIRMLDGDVTDLVEAKSLGIRPDYIDIYSSSWGPKDDGRTVDGPGPLTRQALEQGIKKGRKGLGSIFVWASGNGGRQLDHCSCDGYTSSIFTVSISSTTEHGNRPWYLEPCSAILASTYSRGELNDRTIVTTDLHQRCTDRHTGTSVSAPIVAGIIALALEANHLYGFGLVDAEAMVQEASKWRTVPPQRTCTHKPLRPNSYIHAGQTLNSSTVSSGCSDEADREVKFLEHVVVSVLLTHPRRGDLEISLISPSGTRSQLLAKRLYDGSNQGFRNWEFMSVHFWGEKAEGSWTLEIKDCPSKLRNTEVLGNLKEWSLTLYGTSEDPYLHHSSSTNQDVPGPEGVLDEPELQEEEEEEYNGPCHSDCGDQGCDGPKAEHCLNCAHFSLGRPNTERACVSHCPVGYFGDVAARRCKRCHRNCERCLGQSEAKCSSCRRGLYMNPLSSTCVDTCPQGHYGNQGPGKGECIRCTEGFLQQEWRCVQACAPGYYSGQPSAGRNRMCHRCEENCLSCSGPGTACLRCKDGFSLVSRTCVVNSSCNNGKDLL